MADDKRRLDIDEEGGLIIRGDVGPGDRATVALVGAKVDEVKAIVAGHAAVTELSLDSIKEKIAPLADVPDRLTKVEARVGRLEEKDEDRDQTSERGREWKRGAVWAIILFALGALVNIAIAYHWI